MLKKRIIVKFLIESGCLVKYTNFTKNRRIAGNPLSTALIYEDYIVDEMMFCDVATVDQNLVRKVTDGVFTPVSVAGGIKSFEQAATLIRDCGADKIVTKDLHTAEGVAKKYGSNAVVWAIDYNEECNSGAPDCAGEALLTDMSRDGTYKGLDLHVLNRSWKMPVTIAGGCGRLSDVKDAFDAGADGVAISSMFFFTDKSPIKLRSYLCSNGVNVRAS